MTVTIWGMIRLLEIESQPVAGVVPSLQGTLCFGQTQKTTLYNIGQTRPLEGIRQLTTDSDICAALAAGDKAVISEALRVASSTSQHELLDLFRELKKNIAEMSRFVSDMGRPLDVQSQILIWGIHEDPTLLAETEEEALARGRELLSDVRIMGWFEMELSRRQSQARRARAAANG